MLGQVNNEGRLDRKERHEIGTRVQGHFKFIPVNKDKTHARTSK